MAHVSKIVLYLPHFLRLESDRLDGILSDQRDEVWYIIDPAETKCNRRRYCASD